MGLILPLLGSTRVGRNRRSKFRLPPILAIVAVLTLPGLDAAAQTPGTVQAFTPTNSTPRMVGITADAAGNVYIATNGDNNVVPASIAKGVLSGGAYSGTALTITGVALTQPYGLAVDSSGALYIANGSGQNVLKAVPSGGSTYAATAIATTTDPHILGVAVDSAGDIFYSTDHSAYEIPSGSTTPVQIGSGFGFAYNISVDRFRNVYVTDLYNGVYKITHPTGSTPYTKSLLAITGLSYPESAVSDAFGNLYITNEGSSELIEAVLSNGTYTNYNIQAQTGDAFDYIAPSGVVYTVASNSAAKVYTFTPTSYIFVANRGGTVSSYDQTIGNPITPLTTSVSGGGIGAAVDYSGNVWSITATGTGVTKFAASGSALNTYTPAGAFNGASAIAIDGAGSVWVAQGSPSSNVYELTNAGATISQTGYAQAGGISAPASVSVDTAGSLWIANSGNNTVTEVIGVATPVATPVATAIPGVQP